MTVLLRFGKGALPALVRRAFGDGRTRTLGFALLFGIYSYLQPKAYASSYRTLAERESFVRAFGSNTAVRMFYGAPHDLLSVSGYAGWRVAGTLSIFGAVWGLLAAVRALRNEEESGRTEVILAGPLRQRTLLLVAFSAAGLGVLVLWIAEVLGSVAGGLALAGSAFMALATASVLAVFVGIGAVACQLASTRRGALELASAVAAVGFMLRVVADTAGGLGWLRWLTPLGWAENMRPFTGARPWVLVLPALATVVTLTVATRLAAQRDVGSGLFAPRDRARPRLRLLSSSTAQTLRTELPTLLIWAICLSGFGVVIGALSSSTGNGAISPQLQREIAKLGAGSIATPAGYLGLTMLFFILAVCVFACVQLAGARHEEAEGRLETLLAEPLGRLRWLGGRVTGAVAIVVGLSMLSSLGAWTGSVAAGMAVPLSKMAEAGLNFLPTAFLFLGIATLAYAVVPRMAGMLSYGLLTLAFIWQLVGSVIQVPTWLRDATPFAHIGLVPAAPAQITAGLAMVGTAGSLLLAAAVAFQRRDLSGA
jgi:polyether ionophore transport system permease protein